MTTPATAHASAQATLPPIEPRTPEPGLDLAHHPALERTWHPPMGRLMRVLGSVDHKVIAKRYIVTAFVFFLLGGIEAALMRIQLARPENRFIGPDRYNQLFTTHGSTMLFLFAVPIGEAFGLYLVPLMVGTRNVAFPRLNAFGYWTYVIGGLLLYAGLLTNTGPDAGWFAYVPLSGPEFSPGKRMDIWAQMITFTEVAAIATAVNIITTAFKMRAPGMSLDRVPVLVWGQVVTAFCVLFAMPVIASASLMLGMDRLMGTHFFNPAEGGDALLWQQLFWFFGHPEVYIIFIPALGFTSMMVTTFSGRPLVGYKASVLSLVTIGFLSFGLWVHHMFATPLPQLGQAMFTAASAIIAIPTGIQIFCWIATMALGRVRWTVPMLYSAGFVFLFLIGGMSGLYLAAIPVDLQLTDTYFLPGHIHYVLIGGMVFPLLGAFHYWFPKATGRQTSARVGRWEFALLFAGANVTFFPMLLLALEGMPRRVYTYLASTGWGALNLVASVGAAMFALGILLFVGNLLVSARRGRLAGADPWGGETLEWATSSPPPPWNFAHVPVVESRSPLWHAMGALPVVTGLSEERREVLLTTMLDAEPDARHEVPDETVWPMVTALGIAALFIVLVFTPWGLVTGPIVLFVGLLGWAWPRRPRPNAVPEIVEVP